MKNLLTVRAAAEADVRAIHRLLEIYADRGVVLRRDEADIRFYLGNFTVAESGGEVCGCAAVRDFGGDLLEIRSLVVDPALQGKGIGRAMVEAIIAGLRLRRQSWRLFTLTGAPGFFAALGFRRVDRELFPEKIWSDCAKCAKNDRCDEVALMLQWPEPEAGGMDSAAAGAAGCHTVSR